MQLELEPKHARVQAELELELAPALVSLSVPDLLERVVPFELISAVVVTYVSSLQPKASQLVAVGISELGFVDCESERQGVQKLRKEMVVECR